MENKREDQDVRATEDYSLASAASDKFGAQLETWRKQYSPRPLSVIEVEDKMIVLRPMTPAVMSQYSMMLANEGMDVATRYALNALMLGGDAELIDDDEYFMVAMMQFANTVELKKGRASKL